MLDMISGFMKQEPGGLPVPVWGWFALVFGIACVLIVVILVTCLVKRGNKNQADGETSADSEESKDNSKQTEVKETPAKDEAKKEVKEEKSEQPAKKEKTTAKKTTTAKSSTTKTTAKKEDSAKKSETAENSEPKVYHISKRKDDGKWQVKAEGADRALRLFFTQADAITYAKKVAGNQEGRIVVHRESGGFRKLNY